MSIGDVIANFTHLPDAFQVGTESAYRELGARILAASVHTKNDWEEMCNFYNILSTIIHDRLKMKIGDFNAKIGSTILY
ncbi:hypothetical protein DPMN_016328 [Dreissena polymorpha]|uniref:Uncharacterized protein n=1 Tax=Dreissena polymorpha TaxID=45954 RepID=A0A9D4S4I0_DREPO|nr:hypothetical protein DPMN_016328 [Dreissena polymorpha]